MNQDFTTLNLSKVLERFVFLIFQVLWKLTYCSCLKFLSTFQISTVNFPISLWKSCFLAFFRLSIVSNLRGSEPDVSMKSFGGERRKWEGQP